MLDLPSVLNFFFFFPTGKILSTPTIHRTFVFLAVGFEPEPRALNASSA